MATTPHPAQERSELPDSAIGVKPHLYGRPSNLPNCGWSGWPRVPSMCVVNPMHIVTLTERKESRIVRYAEKIKAVSEKWFTHVLLLFFLFGYAALGAVIFQLIEGPVETQGKVGFENIRKLIIKDLWDLYERHDTEEDWREQAFRRFMKYEEQVLQSVNSSVKTNPDSKQWTFVGAMFYCGTIFTTIGYGNIYPKTNAGRAATIVYAFFGIPLMLMVLADLGKFFTRTIKLIYSYIRQFYHTGECRRIQRIARKDKNHPTQYMTLKFNSNNEAVPTNPSLESRSFDESEDNRNGNDSARHRKPDSFEVDDEFNLPISLGLFFLVIYIMIGAFIFTLWENWSFFEAFYFVFISMSTIGFGDYVPEHPIYVMATFIYLLFGLALTSMCINVVQEKLSATFEKAKVRLGTTMGLDVNSLLQSNLAPEVAKMELAEVHGRRSSKEHLFREDINKQGKSLEARDL
ncbi:TWiK family of potassium channels protein 18-like [Limulus polyphemus]|uniref:TWiK family of potassium channels protein 18-like n=1 Tax=Limulus polyphemus TaxID=6850 RepID=A0ABM1B5D8_LIMPO|nr:TWiK family of potassium channels protein 18-like [Limulus polyphemus]